MTAVELAAQRYPLVHPDIQDYENDDCINRRCAFVEGYEECNLAFGLLNAEILRLRIENERLCWLSIDYK